MKASKKTLAVVVGSAFVASIAATSVNAATNPFQAKTLSAGYMLADGSDKMKDGKCGTGKCGAEKKKMMEEKAKEGSCSADKAKEGSCHADKAKEGSCSADKAKEGSCHADK
ncbi:MAG TPA: hypothetical protein VN063_01520 [Methylophilaceae bacterium]|nr:hypothetical protein [Methylophilaceae bacterium]